MFPMDDTCTQPTVGNEGGRPLLWPRDEGQRLSPPQLLQLLRLLLPHAALLQGLLRARRGAQKRLNGRSGQQAEEGQQEQQARARHDDGFGSRDRCLPVLWVWGRVDRRVCVNSLADFQLIDGSTHAALDS